MSLLKKASLFAAVFMPFAVQAACVDNVVMVHGNTGTPSQWDNTVSLLISKGWTSSQIYRPDWGYKSALQASLNSHDSTNTGKVKTAITNALNSSCTGKIDVLGHSMGVTLAMKAINELGVSGRVDSFVGIAGAQHGLLSCGVYPFNVMTPTCGSQGLSVGSPLINSVRSKRYGARMYSIKSWMDEIVCGAGSCLIYGSHTSNIDYQNASYDYALGHFGLLFYTSTKQWELIK
ncbi:MAG TPA: alpha/beta fold hydrolase [Rhodocyclaceae bacterium]|nr:alpha/beta fold hydrolase [Rhodocyclaceae bacterium]